MKFYDMRQQLTEPIISQNGELKFDFIFDTENSGRIDLYDHQLEVRVRADWEFDAFTQAVIVTIKLEDSSDRTREIITYLSDFRDKLTQMESAYDFVGE